MRTNCCTSRRGRTGRRRSSKDQGHIEAKWREAAAVGSFVVGTAMDEEDEGRQGSGHGPSGCCGRPIGGAPSSSPSRTHPAVARSGRGGVTRRHGRRHPQPA